MPAPKTSMKTTIEDLLNASPETLQRETEDLILEYTQSKDPRDQIAGRLMATDLHDVIYAFFKAEIDKDGSPENIGAVIEILSHALGYTLMMVLSRVAKPGREDALVMRILEHFGKGLIFGAQVIKTEHEIKAAK